ncbi:MAG: hypothetical protein GVY20_13920 [Bacteroidetes bacterium]|jgi:hypothetical protein|nr:hypothetical protein [Bacteroidota bacterium]
MADKRSRKRKAYTVDQVKLIGSHALMEMERIILSDADNNEKIRASNSIATLINSYRRLIETSEIIERIEALENKQLRKVG